MGTVAKTQVTQIVIPSSLVGTVLKLHHDTPEAGHPGRDRTLSMARAKYYLPTMRLDIEKHIAQCLPSAETKGTTAIAPILEYPLPAGPFNVVGIDLLQLPSVFKALSMSMFALTTLVVSQSWPIYLTSAIPLYLILSAPRRLLMVSSVTMGQNLRIRSFGKSALDFTFNRHLLHHITLLLTASWNVPTRKSLGFCATLQDIYRKLGGLAFSRCYLY